MMNMEKLHEIDESQYKVDFMISENYIKFSSELLRLALLALGGFGTIIIGKFDNNLTKEFLLQPSLLIGSLGCFVLTCIFSLFHRYYATDTMSYYVAWLRANKAMNSTNAEKEREDFYSFLKLAERSLIRCEFAFGSGVVLFLILLGIILFK